MDFFIYVGILVVFLIAMKFLIPILNKLTQSMSNAAGAGQAQESFFNSWEQFAQQHGLQYTAVKESSDPKIFQVMGVRIQGLFKNHPLDIHYYSEAKELGGLSHGYTWTRVQRITFKTSKAASWQILPKQKNMVSQPTGIADFDSHLIFIGNKHELGDVFLRDIAKFGWMNLTLNNGELVFEDDFYEFIQQQNGSMAMMGVVHPVWGTSVSNTTVDPARIKHFLNFLEKLL